MELNVNFKDLKINWRKHLYLLVGLLIAAILAFIIIRSLVFLVSQVSTISQSGVSAPANLIKFDLDNFEKIKIMFKVPAGH